jgi:hypothetical protein
VDGVSEAVARFPLRNIRDLQRALAGVVAHQERSGRPVTVEDVPRLMSDLLNRPGPPSTRQAPLRAGGVKPAPAPKAAQKPPAASGSAVAPGRAETSGPGPAPSSAAGPGVGATKGPSTGATRAGATPMPGGAGAKTPGAADPMKGRKGPEAWRKRIYRAADIARAEHVSAVKLVRLSHLHVSFANLSPPSRRAQGFGASEADIPPLRSRPRSSSSGARRRRTTPSTFTRRTPRGPWRSSRPLEGRTSRGTQERASASRP